MWISVELPTADPSQFRSREKRQFEGLDSSNSESDETATEASGGDDSSDNTIKVKFQCFFFVSNLLSIF